jgi:hypothetical protein
MNKEKILKISLIVMAVVLILIALVNALDFYLQQQSWRQENAQFEERSRQAASLLFSTSSAEIVEEGQPADDYQVEASLGTACQIESDCVLPMEYAMQSRCPFTVKCISGGCAVVCPLGY